MVVGSSFHLLIVGQLRGTIVPSLVLLSYGTLVLKLNALEVWMTLESWPLFVDPSNAFSPKQVCPH